MSINGFYPVSLASVVVLTWRYSLNPLVSLLLLAVVWASVAVHELGHVAVVCWTGGSVTRVTITPGHGMTSVLQRDRLAFAMIALAGPVAGLAVGATALFVLGWLSGPSVVTAFAISLRGVLWAGMCDNALNLMPVGVLDGNQFAKAIREWRTRHRPMEPVRKTSARLATEVRYSNAA